MSTTTTFSNLDEIIKYVDALRGDDLKRHATDHEIKGRSKLKAADLRLALVQSIADAHKVPLATIPDEPEDVDTTDQDVLTLVPNRADRRRFKRNRGKIARKTPNGTRQSRRDASIRAGQRGKDYGHRNPNALRANDFSTAVSSGAVTVPFAPRAVPVRVRQETVHN